ncbi:MAG TPA: rubrerythrin family protein [Erysipelotrichaceae bacterium]|nr:rubrerythrin family protein [Erysipelotrichaceae bacterium]
MNQISEKTLKLVYQLQKAEMTEYIVYQRIAKRIKDDENRSILLNIAKQEKAHADIWKSYTKKEAKPNTLVILFFDILNRIFGYTFTLKIMERGEDKANHFYQDISQEIPIATKIANEEEEHEQTLIGMLDEERLQYVGSMVLGLNDALVELTGTLAGLSFALQNTKIIALSGLVTGISATLSMASSEYLSARSDGNENALKSAFYTGIMYIVAVVLLVAPYLIAPVDQYLPALLSMLIIVIVIIFIFTYYISVAKDLPFKRRFLEMAGISISVATLSFFIGLAIKYFLNIDI